MEPSNNNASSSDGFSNTNAPSSTFTFTTPSVSGLSRPRFVKVRKHNNAPAFNPFRDPTVPVPVPVTAFSSATAGNGAFALGASKGVDFGASFLEKGISDQMRSLKIGNASNREGFEKVRSSPFVDENLVSKGMSKLNIDRERLCDESELQNELKEKLSIAEAQRSGGGGGDSVAEDSANAVVNQMKNLNVNEESGVGGMKFGKGTGTEAVLLRKMENLNLVNEKKDSAESNKLEEEIRVFENAASSSPSSSTMFGGINFQPVGSAFGATKRDEFVFTGKQDTSGSGSSFVEFKAPAMAPKTGLSGGVDEKFKSNAKKEKGGNMRMNKSRVKLKHYASSAQPWHGQGFILKESVVPQEDLQGSPDACSPMDVSPYQEKLAGNQCLREDSVTSNSDSFSTDSNCIANDLAQTTSIDPIDEDLIAATECLNINGGDVPCRETKEETSAYHMRENIHVEDKQDESLSGVETESFKSANDEVGISDAACTSAETETFKSANGSVLSPRNVSGSAFTFAASASSAEAQSSSPKRNHKKKNWVNVGHDTYNYTPNIKVPYSSSSVAFSPFSGTSSLFTSGQALKAKVSSPQPKTRDSELNKEQGLKEASASISAASIAAQEACEKWRLR